MSIITLTTDFGLKDGNVGVMKGVIAGIAPAAQVIDLSHFISPQDVWEGAFILGRSAPFFPENTIHVGVVDPGVGTQRRPIAARLGKQLFVGPDNGLCSMMWLRAQQEGLPVAFYHLNKPDYWLPEVSNVFHGRDIFSPAGAHLARGVSLDKIGTPIHDPIRLEIAAPTRMDQGWEGEVIHIDHFGNIATNILREHLSEMTPASVRLCGQTIPGLVRTFGERPVGELIALFGSTGNLIVSVVNGNAASRLKAQRGDPVKVFMHA